MGDSPPPDAQHAMGSINHAQILEAGSQQTLGAAIISMGKMSITTGFPLLCHPSLTGGVARRRVRPRPVFSLRQPMQALCFRGRCGQRRRKKTLEVWLSA